MNEKYNEIINIVSPSDKNANNFNHKKWFFF